LTAVSTPNDPPELRSREILTALERHGVKYLIIGGFGAQLHGATRLTKDLDLCPAWSHNNFDRLASALIDLDARLRLPPELGKVDVFPNARLLREFPLTPWRTRAGDVDVLLAIVDRDGVPVAYSDLASRAVTVRAGDVTVLVAGLEDIIGAKERAGRPKDLEVLPELHAIQARKAQPAAGQSLPAQASHRAPGSASASWSPRRAGDRARRPPTLGR
jgi:hypothetical protein